jgi:hypothetical protein
MWKFIVEITASARVVPFVVFLGGLKKKKIPILCYSVTMFFEKVEKSVKFSPDFFSFFWGIKKITKTFVLKYNKIC